MGLSAICAGIQRSWSVGGGIGVYCWAGCAACGRGVEVEGVEFGSGGCGRGEFAAPEPEGGKGEGPAAGPAAKGWMGVPLRLGSALWETGFGGGGGGAELTGDVGVGDPAGTPPSGDEV